ncbi:MAG: lytic transglycosylase domain-containing protein [Xanthobacteraceae bacterium]|nr:lytic transglycosylase domain-containing protein [Xanthobacteraceae bacterium]
MRLALLCASIAVVTALLPATAECSAAGTAEDHPAVENSKAPGVEPAPDAAAGRASPAAAPSPNPSLSRAELCDLATDVAAAYDLPAAFFANLIHQESGFRPRAGSPAGALGIAQFMPATASSRGLQDPFEPAAALNASGKFLSELYAQFGNFGLAAAAYNAGPRRVQDWLAKRGSLPAETRNYVHRITGHPADAWTGSGKAAPQITAAWHSGCPAVGSPAGPQVASLQPGRTEAASPQKDNPGPERLAVRAREGGSTPHRRGLPRPSEFIVGKPVPAAVKATEAAVLARQKTRPARADEVGRIRSRFAELHGPSARPQRKS